MTLMRMVMVMGIGMRIETPMTFSMIMNMRTMMTSCLIQILRYCLLHKVKTKGLKHLTGQMMRLIQKEGVGVLGLLMMKRAVVGLGLQSLIQRLIWNYQNSRLE